MANEEEQPAKKPGRKVRVAFRRNRQGRQRNTDVTREVRDSGEMESATERTESVFAKGALSRKRTIIVPHEDEATSADLRTGTVVAVRGLYVEVDDGREVWNCTIRRILRTRLISGRNAVSVGDHVLFRPEPTADAAARDGVIEKIEPRHGELLRRAGKRIHTIAANIDQAIIVNAAREPRFKPQLIDRYIVSAHAGGITPIVCINKIDLDEDGVARDFLTLYEGLGYTTLAVSAATGEGMERLRDQLRGRSSVFAGQSGVGKSSLLNGIQPALGLNVCKVSVQTEKGKHTTTTAVMYRLDFGGFVVDTPGIRSFDLTVVPRNEYEAHFVEFLPHVPNCKFPDCTHTHEGDCAVKAAVESGAIHPFRYESYVFMFENPGSSG